jgi:hypothetical protein
VDASAKNAGIIIHVTQYNVPRVVQSCSLICDSRKEPFFKSKLGYTLKRIHLFSKITLYETDLSENQQTEFCGIGGFYLLVVFGYTRKLENREKSKSLGCANQKHR